MNLDKVQLVRETADEFVLKDEDGKQFSVAKRAVGGTTVQQIKQHFASGGTVMDDEDFLGGIPLLTIDLDGDGVPDPIMAQAPQMARSHAPGAAVTGALPPRTMQSHRTGAQVFDGPRDPGGVPGDISGEIQAVAPPPTQPSPSPVPSPLYNGPGGIPGDAGSEVEAIMGRSAPGAAPADPSQAAPMQMVPSHVPGAQVGPVQAMPSHVPGEPVAPEAMEGMFASGGNMDAPKSPKGATPGIAGPVQPKAGMQAPQADEIGDNARMEEDAVRQKAVLEGQASQDALRTREWLQKEMQRVHEERLAAYNDNMARGEQIYQSVLNKQIEPNRIFKNANTGSKLAAGFAMLVGGLAQGMRRGGPNVALELMEKAIDRDIDAQKTDLAKGQWAVNYHLRKGEDINNAAQLAKADLLDAAAGQLQIDAQRYTGQMAQQNAAIEIAAIREKARVARETTGMRSTVDKLHHAQLRAQEFDLSMKKEQYATFKKQQAAMASGVMPPMEMMQKEDRERHIQYGGHTIPLRSGGDATEAAARIQAEKDLIPLAARMKELRDKATVKDYMTPVEWNSIAQESKFIQKKMIGNLRIALFGPGAMISDERMEAMTVIPQPLDLMGREAYDTAFDTILTDAHRGVWSAIATRTTDPRIASMPPPDTIKPAPKKKEKK